MMNVFTIFLLCSCITTNNNQTSSYETLLNQENDLIPHIITCCHEFSFCVECDSDLDPFVDDIGGDFNTYSKSVSTDKYSRGLIGSENSWIVYKNCVKKVKVLQELPQELVLLAFVLYLLVDVHIAQFVTVKLLISEIFIELGAFGTVVGKRKYGRDDEVSVVGSSALNDGNGQIMDKNSGSLSLLTKHQDKRRILELPDDVNPHPWIHVLILTHLERPILTGFRMEDPDSRCEFLLALRTCALRALDLDEETIQALLAIYRFQAAYVERLRHPFHHFGALYFRPDLSLVTPEEIVPFPIIPSLYISVDSTDGLYSDGRAIRAMIAL